MSSKNKRILNNKLNKHSNLKKKDPKIVQLSIEIQKCDHSFNLTI